MELGKLTSPLSVPATLLAAGIKINIIGELDELITRMRMRNGVDYFEWPTDGRGAAVEANLLRYYGISFFGLRGSFSDFRGLHVPREQGKWAEWLLLRVETPLTKRPGYYEHVDPGPLPSPFNVPRRPPGLSGLLINWLLPVTLPYRHLQTPEAIALFESGQARRWRPTGRKSARMASSPTVSKYTTSQRRDPIANRHTHKRMRARPNTPVK